MQKKVAVNMEFWNLTVQKLLNSTSHVTC